MKFKFLLPTHKFWASLVALIATTCASAEKYVPMTTEYFSQGMMTFFRKNNIVKAFIKTVDGVECIDVEGPTTFNLTSDVTDTKGLRLFKKLTSINATGIANYCKHFDARGLTNLKSIKFTTYDSDGVTATANDKIILSTILVDSTGIQDLRLPRCINLRHVSCSNCPNLETVYLYECDLMGLNLASSTKLKQVIVYGNPNLSVLRLPQSAPDLTQVHCCHTNLQELILPADMANGTAGDRQIVLNVDRTQIKKLVMPVYDPDMGLKKPYIKTFIYGNGSLLSMNVSQMDAGTGTWTAGTKPTNPTVPTNTTRVGHVQSFTIFDDDENLTNDKNTKTTASGFTAGAGTFDGRVFTFAEGKTSVSYKISTWTQRNIKQAPISCTVSRTLDAPDIYLEFEENNETLDRLYAKYMGEDIVESFDENGKPKYKRIRLDYKGDNTYELKPECLLGNFHFVVVSSDGKEAILGANDADLTEMLPDWDHGHAYLDCRTAGVQRAASVSVFSLHLEQAAAKKNSHVRSNQLYSKSTPHAFTTHYNEPTSRVGRLENPTLTLTYIKDDPASSLSVSAPGGTTAIDDIIVDNLPGFGDSFDEDAPVLYYDLQGRRVDNPACGMYIRRQGSRAEKVLIR